MMTLHQAARAGNLSELSRLLEEGAEIEAYDEKDQTPLMAACLSYQAGIEVVSYLLDRDANPHACLRQQADPLAEAPPLISLAVKSSSCEKIRLLIERGADLHYRSPHGYSLLIHAACAGREAVIDLLLAVGAPLDAQSDYKESALSVLSNAGRFDAVRKILDHGADPAPLEWTPLMRAIALGSLQEITDLLDGSADLESRDFWERTPLLLAIQSGDIGKAKLLLERGADRKATGRCGKTPMQYPLDRDDTRMLAWLIDNGFDVHQENEFGHPPILEAVENDAPACFRLLLDAGAEFDVWEEEILSHASDPEIVGILFDRGSELAKLESSVVREFIGLATTEEMTANKEQFSAARTRRFGTANPEPTDIPFWRAMVRCGWSGHQADSHFESNTDFQNSPVWCHERFGMSLTKLPDGRFIQIAGEHEDHYDPDFCIYNDVIVHDGKGGFEIFGYPEGIFPPTDFHSATLVGDWIYIIGNLGYREQRGTETPIYRLQLDTWKIEPVSTHGSSPGWIHSHRAVLENGRIRISGGKRFAVDSEGQQTLDPFEGTWRFDIASATWHFDDT